ncbi:hypothetical protein LTR60_004685, partial [Cryomyces antarcticus]
MRSDNNNGGGPEKPGKRPRGPPREKTQKKGKPHTLAAAPIASPPKTDRERQDRLQEWGVENAAQLRTWEDPNSVAALQTGHGGPTIERPMPHPVDNTLRPASAHDGSERSRQGGLSSLQRAGASSYWSVPEQNDFGKFVAYFGTDWGAIASYMGTKTPTMRLAESGNRIDLTEDAATADAKRLRGDDMGPPPVATQIVKRRYDNFQPAVPRPLAPSTDVMEIDDPPPPQLPQTHVRTSPSQYQHGIRFSTMSQASPTQAQSVVTSQSHAVAATSVTPTQVLPPQQRLPTQHLQPPRMGFFSDSRPEHRHPLTPQAQPTPQSLRDEEHPAELQRAQDSQFMRRLQQTQEAAREVEARYAHRDRFSQGFAHPDPPSRVVSQSSAPSQVRSAQPNPVSMSDVPGQTVQQSHLQPRQPSSTVRHLIDVPKSSSPASAPLQPGLGQSIPSLPPRDGGRLFSIGNQSHPQSLPEPRKTSNLASILNSEPEEPRPHKRYSDHAVPAMATPTQSPAPAAYPTGPPPPPSGHATHSSRRDTFGEASAAASQYQRSS